MLKLYAIFIFFIYAINMNTLQLSCLHPYRVEQPKQQILLQLWNMK